MPKQPERLSPDAVREKVMAGDATLVCAYDDQEKCAAVRLTDSVALADLPDSPAEDRLLVFYCA